MEVDIKMIITGLISTKEEVEEIKFIAKIAVIANRFQNL